MANDKESLDPFAVTMGQTADQITKQALEVMENYFGWLQKIMSTHPFAWSNTNLNRILLSNVTQNVTATFMFVHKLSQAKDLQEEPDNASAPIRVFQSKYSSNAQRF